MISGPKFIPSVSDSFKAHAYESKLSEIDKSNNARIWDTVLRMP